MAGKALGVDPWEIVERWTWCQFWIAYKTLEDAAIAEEWAIEQAKSNAREYAPSATGRERPGRTMGLNALFDWARANGHVRKLPCRRRDRCR